MKQREKNRRLTIIRAAILTVALIAAFHASADFEAGQSAWDAGNVDEALSHWQDAANAGDRRAMLELGRLYRQGLGVVQDYIEAHKWLNLAASRGEAAALEERDALAAQMTPEQIATAQQRAAAWQPGGGSTQTQEASSAQDTGQPPPQAIRAAQSLLTALGYQPGPADGVWGQGTRAAYQAFLRDMGLPQMDTLTPEALRAIQAAAEQQGVAPTGDETTTAETAKTFVPSQTQAPPLISPDALHNAAQAGDLEVLKAAITAGVDVNARDSRGWTALMHAVNKEHVLIVESLIKAGAYVNLRAPDAASALFMAVVLGHTEIVELLIMAGAHVSIPGPKGKALVDVAKLKYGEVGVARKNGEPPVVLALLEGKSLAVEEAKRERERQRRERERQREEAKRKRIEAKVKELEDGMLAIPAGTFRMGDLTTEESTTMNCIVDSGTNASPAACPVTTLEPLCTGETGRGCWIEATNQAGCYLWNPSPQPGEKVTWSGCCVDCKASGKGEIVWRFLKDGSRGETITNEDYLHAGYSSVIGREAEPDHTVTVPAFKLGKYEVTFAQWDACVADGGCYGYTLDEGWGRGNRPVINVSWNDAQSFIDWLNNKTGGNFRLPTEAEWEYAARAGTTTLYSWGDDIGSNRANCDNYACGDSWEYTAPVGSFPANPWGLHDMHGNVFEWVQDCWNDSYQDAPEDGSAWTSGDCSKRVARGGACFGAPKGMRSARRARADRLGGFNGVGFRLAQDE